ncbi:MAG: holdfast anchoring protein HfaA [Caulobacteraceae bacterium]|nr:holdfast anchoring protein HfaA [Caulobacteraceae bacterium]
MRSRHAVGIALAAFAISAGAASAQNLSTTSSSYNAGYGRTPGDEERGVTTYGMRDANGNLIAVNGIVTSSASAQASAAAWGASYGGSGAGFAGQYGSATAIGNNLNVTVQGNWNTVIVDSTQINNGDVSASVELNGQVDLDDHP